MFSTVLSASVYGMESMPVHVEADVGDGLPGFQMVGYPSAQVKEAQDRVRTALKNSGYRLEPKKITVNLAPADIRKNGSGFDLPIAVAVAAGYGKIPPQNLEKIMVVGELSLSGEVNGVTGILPMLAGAAGSGCRACMIPRANIREGAMIREAEVIGVSSLKEAIGYLDGSLKRSPHRLPLPPAPDGTEGKAAEDFADICGQKAARRAAEVAVSGFHNLLLVGPPGAGKSLIARRIPGILPPMTFEESLEVSMVYSVAGQFPADGSLLLKRPFRSPHHTATAKALAGGGRTPQPGEVSLAHNGVLFLDELPEFSREALEILRQPLEDKQVWVARAGGACCFPSNIMLVAAMNPCPCGYYPNMDKCTCTRGAIEKYQSRISAPLLERIDVTVEVSPVGYRELNGAGENEGTGAIRERVMRTLAIERERYRHTPFRFNADLNGAGIETYCFLGKEERQFMKEAFEKLSLSARSYHRILKVARTIADMEEAERIAICHLQEALCYRSIGKGDWMGR